MSLCLDWYDGLTGFTVFEVLDLLLVVLALATAAALAGEPRPPAARLGVAADGALAGLRRSRRADRRIAVAERSPRRRPSVGEKDLGIWLALAGAALMVVGSALATSHVSLAVDVQRAGRPRSKLVATPAPDPAAEPGGATTVADPPARPANATRASEPPTRADPPTDPTARP